MSAEQSTALTVTQRATLALGLSDIEKTLQELAGKSTSITAITNADGYEQCRSSRIALKNQRIEIEKRGKEARDDAQKFSKAVIAEQNRLIAIIEPEEARLQKLESAHDDAIEAAKQARIDAELKRVTYLQERVTYLRGNQSLTSMTDSALLAEHISDLEGEPVDDSFQEFRQQAEDAKAAGLARLRQLHAASIERETEQARIEAEREELAELRAIQAKRDAEERARIAEEERKQREKLAAEVAAERKRIAEEDDAAKAIREAEAAERQEAQQRNEMALEEIRGIQHQVMIASCGRSGVRQGGTLECIEETLAETEAWVIDDRFGVFIGSARNAKTSAIEAIKAQRDSFLQAAEAKASQEKLDAERAALEAEQAEARRVKEEEERAKREQARIASLKRPDDEELMDVIATYYNVPRSKAIEWVLAIDFSKVEAA